VGIDWAQIIKQHKGFLFLLKDIFVQKMALSLYIIEFIAMNLILIYVVHGLGN
jgi:hypothetical protein